MLVQNKGNHPYTANGLTLNPGTNNVNEKEFEKFLEHPLMQHLNEQEEFLYEKAEQKQLSAKELIAMIEDAYDVEMLQELKVNEERKTVLDAIEKRIQELQNPEQ